MLQVVDLPAATRELPPGARPNEQRAADPDIAEDLEEKAQAKAEKIKKMQERLAAWQEQQKASEQ